MVAIGHSAKCTEEGEIALGDYWHFYADGTLSGPQIERTPCYKICAPVRQLVGSILEERDGGCKSPLTEAIAHTHLELNAIARAFWYYTLKEIFTEDLRWIFAANTDWERIRSFILKKFTGFKLIGDTVFYGEQKLIIGIAVLELLKDEIVQATIKDVEHVMCRLRDEEVIDLVSVMYPHRAAAGTRWTKVCEAIANGVPLALNESPLKELLCWYGWEDGVQEFTTPRLANYYN